MQDGPELTSDMQAAVDGVFARLPVHYQTEVIKAEIADAVVRSKGVSRSAYEATARSTVVGMFSSLDRVIANHPRQARPPAR